MTRSHRHSGRFARLALALFVPLSLVCAPRAGAADELDQRLGEVVVEDTRPMSAASSDEIRARDFALRPHDTMMQILNNIPGLVAVQHQGGGKATQWLIRGFDADHGTDIAVSVDGLPVNLVSHAHGQGYADLNFLIPETVERVQLAKGPYFVQYGDLANAGSLNFVTHDTFKENFVLAEGGSFDTQRYVAGMSHDFGGVTALVAGQAYRSNGPFDNPQNYGRYNGYAKVTASPSATSRFSASAGLYQGDWDGSGQIPLRLVSAGRLDRFGALDPTEGGRSDRENLDIHYEVKPRPDTTWALQAYGSRYKLALWSDFTFYRDTGYRFVRAAAPLSTDFIPGDGIEQNDQRLLYGGRGSWTRTWSLFGRPVSSQVGLESRNDQIHLALHRQWQRHRFFTVNELAVDERSVGTFMGHEVFLADWARLEVGLRGDVFFFDAFDRLPAQGPDPNFAPVRIDGRTSDAIVSPKANLILTPFTDTDLYFNFGEGYHSNDARNAVLGRNTDFSPLAKSLGYETGIRTRQWDRLDAAAAVWLLDLESELVFSGDAGNQETGTGGNFQPSGKTRRWGVDLEARYQLTRWLFADYDLTWADPRYLNGDAIALAPTLLMNGGLTAELPHGFSVALRTRFLDDRPAIEDRSLTARGYTLLDLIGRWRWRKLEVGVALTNLTNTNWREAQFADNTCVRGEVGRRTGCSVAPGQQSAHATDPLPDVHFTPGNPFGVRAGLTVFF